MGKKKVTFTDKFSVLKHVDLLAILRKNFNREDFRLGFNLCCFHNDSRPSLLITKFNNIYRYQCKSCGAAGDALTYLRDHAGYATLKEQVKYLQSGDFITATPEAGCEEALEKALGQDSSCEPEFAALRKMCVEFLKANIGNSALQEVYTWITTKFTADLALCDDLDIGIFDAESARHNKDLTTDFWKSINLDLDKLSDDLKVCVVLFLRSSMHTVNGFIMRPKGSTSHEQKQYMFKAVRGYGGLQLLDLEGIRSGSEYTVVVEGFTDMAAIQTYYLRKYGVPINCISICGTGGMNNIGALSVLEGIVTHTGGQLRIFPDNDVPGIQAVQGLCQNHHILNLRVKIIYPDGYEVGTDPQDYVNNYSEATFGESLSSMLDRCAYSLPEFYYRYASNLIIHDKQEGDPEKCLEVYEAIAVQAQLMHVDLEMYAHYVANGLRNSKGELLYKVMVLVSKESLIQAISSNQVASRTINILGVDYNLAHNEISETKIAFDKNGNDSTTVRSLTNWGFRLQKVIVSPDGNSKYVGDVNHKNPAYSRRNVTISDEGHDHVKFIRNIAKLMGGCDMHFANTSKDMQAIRDVCLHKWHDTVCVQEIGEVGYRQVDGEWIHVTGSHVISKDAIMTNTQYELTGSPDLKLYGFDCPIVASVKELNESVRYALKILGNVYDKEHAHLISIPFAGALLSPLWKDCNEHRFTIYATGSFGCGKTQSQKLVRAFFTHMSKFEQATSINVSTSNYAEGVLSKCRDLPIVFDDYKDELSANGGKELVKLMQSIYDGSGRGRMDKNLSLRATNEIRSTVLMNGEDFPALAQGSTMDRTLIVNLSEGKFNRAAFTETINNPELYSKFQLWVPHYIKYCLAHGPHNKNFEGLNGPERAIRHGKTIYTGFNTFKHFAIQECGFSPDDPLLLEWEGNVRKHILEVVSATTSKTREEEKWQLFRKYIISMLAEEYGYFRSPASVGESRPGKICLGAIYKVGNDVLVTMNYTAITTAIKTKFGVSLTPQAIRVNMIKFGCLLTKTGAVVQSENELGGSPDWTMNASHFFEDKVSVESYFQKV